MKGPWNEAEIGDYLTGRHCRAHGLAEHRAYVVQRCRIQRVGADEVDMFLGFLDQKEPMRARVANRQPPRDL